mgnify:CR=1 FL=1
MHCQPGLLVTLVEIEHLEVLLRFFEHLFLRFLGHAMLTEAVILVKLVELVKLIDTCVAAAHH